MEPTEFDESIPVSPMGLWNDYLKLALAIVVGAAIGVGAFFFLQQGKTANAANPQATAGQTYCICPNCGRKVKHQTGQPCYNVKCPKCGTAMTRQ